MKFLLSAADRAGEKRRTPGAISCPFGCGGVFALPGPMARHVRTAHPDDLETVLATLTTRADSDPVEPTAAERAKARVRAILKDQDRALARAAAEVDAEGGDGPA